MKARLEFHALRDGSMLAETEVPATGERIRYVYRNGCGGTIHAMRIDADGWITHHRSFVGTAEAAAGLTRLALRLGETTGIPSDFMRSEATVRLGAQSPRSRPPSDH